MQPCINRVLRNSNSHNCKSSREPVLKHPDSGQSLDLSLNPRTEPQAPELRELRPPSQEKLATRPCLLVSAQQLLT